MVFQAYNLFPHLTVLDNCTLAPAAGARRTAGARRRQRARDLLARFGLGRPGRQAPRPALRRPAAARRAGPRAVHPARRCCCSTRSPRPSTPSWSATCSRSSATWPRQGTTMVLATHEMGFAREVATTRLLPRRGPDPRAGPAGRRSSATPARSGPASSCAASSGPDRDSRPVMIGRMSYRARPGHRPAARGEGRRARRHRPRPARLHDPRRPRRRRDPHRPAGRPAADRRPHDLLNRGRPSVALDLKQPGRASPPSSTWSRAPTCWSRACARASPSGSASARTSAWPATRGWSTAG